MRLLSKAPYDTVIFMFCFSSLFLLFFLIFLGCCFSSPSRVKRSLLFAQQTEKLCVRFLLLFC